MVKQCNFNKEVECSHNGDCGIQRDIHLFVGDFTFPRCKYYCDLWGYFLYKPLNIKSTR